MLISSECTIVTFMSSGTLLKSTFVSMSLSLLRISIFDFGIINSLVILLSISILTLEILSFTLIPFGISSPTSTLFASFKSSINYYN